MSNLTKEDKLSILKRLVNRVKNWRFQKSLPMIIWMGKPSFSQNSPEFQQWLKDTNDGIGVVFGVPATDIQNVRMNVFSLNIKFTVTRT